MVQTAFIAAAWVACGSIGSVLIAAWWTDELPLTTDELPGLIFGAIILGPLYTMIGMVFMVLLMMKKLAGRFTPRSRVIINRWGR